MSGIEIYYSLPSADLADTIAAYVEVSLEPGAASVIDLLPPDIAMIGVPMSGQWRVGSAPDTLQAIANPGVLFGNSSRARWGESSGGTAFCLGFYPLAWPVLLDARADTHADMAAPINDVLGADGNSLAAAIQTAPDFAGRAAVANAFFEARKRALPDPDVAVLIKAIGVALADPDCAAVETMAERVGISQTRLARLSKAYFGYAPKLLIRRARFRRMLHRMDQHSYDDWRDYIDVQYTDQSHLIRDFRYFMGLSPSRYMALERPFVAAAFASFRKMMAGGARELWQG